MTKAATGDRRCGATTRSGKPCRSPAMFRKMRCRMQGGAPGSGTPKGNRNAQTHGRTTGAALADHRAIGRLLAESEWLLGEIE